LSEALVTIQPEAAATPPAAPAEDIVHDSTTDPEADLSPAKEANPHRGSEFSEELLTPEARDEIVDHAAASLMQAFSDPAGCFLITEDGVCAINPANPPSLIQSYKAVSHILKLDQLGDVIKDKTSWMRGSAIAELEDLHGENFNVSQICKESELNYNTTYQAVTVFKAFKKKRYKLSFSHHQEAKMATISKDDDVNHRIMHLILQKSESHGLGAKQLRSLCSIAKTMEPDDTVIRNIRSKQQAEDLIDAYRANKSEFLVFEDGVWYQFNDNIDAEHEGRVVLNKKAGTATANGVVMDIKKCRPPSTPKS
jgi:hypothetical protein